MENYKALNSDSKNLSDLKDVEPKKFSDISSNRFKAEVFCRVHFIDRMKNYCDRDSLLDVCLSGIESIKFISVMSAKCKSCEEIAEYRIERID